jgi:hypothetical protein
VELEGGKGSIPLRWHFLKWRRTAPTQPQEVVMERLPEDASVRVRPADGRWLVRVAGAGEVLERRFDSENDAEAFASAHRKRLGLDVPPDVS